MTGYPWATGDALLAADLNAAIAQSLLPPGSTAENVKTSHGAVGDGVADDTAAIAAAVATGRHVYLPTGTYKVSDQILLTTLGQRVYGDGIGYTVISVPATFNLARLGVFVMQANSGDTVASISVPGPSISDMDIVFAQVDTAVRASLIQFPAAVYVTQTQRWRVQRLRIMRGWDGIKAYSDVTPGRAMDSVGGAYLNELQLGCLNTNISIDGAQDTMRIHHAHIFPFGLTSNQIAIQTTSTIGIDCYRADDIKMHGCLFLVYQSIRFSASANGVPFGEITNCDFDTYSGIAMSNGDITGSGCMFGSTVAGATGINLTGGQLSLSGCQFFILNAGAASVVVQPGSSGATWLNLSNFIMQSTTNDVTSVAINVGASPGTSMVVLSDGTFLRNPNIAYTKATVQCSSTSAVLLMSNCLASIKGSGAGTFVAITNDNYHRIIGNSSLGWAFSFPTATSAIYAANTPGDIGGAGAYLPLAGGTLSGGLTINTTTADNTLDIQANAGKNRSILFDTVGTGAGPRWLLGATNTAETGSSAGSNFQIAAFSDGGTPSVPVSITRSTGIVNFASTPTVAGVPIPAPPAVNTVTTPLMDGAAAIGTLTTYARPDHVHPTDTTRAPTASPTFTGTVTATGATTNVGAFTATGITASPISGSTGSFTTLAASSTVSGAGFTSLLSPYALIAAPTFTGDAKAVTAAPGDNDTSIATTQFVQTAVGNVHDFGRNMVMNALMNVQARGAGPYTTTGAYSLDRWVLTLTLDTMSVSPQVINDASRTAIGDEAAEFSLQNVFVGNAGATAFNTITQRIEGVRKLGGKTVTVSFWAVAASGTPKLGVSIDQNFGTTGSPSAAVNGNGTAVTLSTTWTRYTATIAVASTSGKTLGTDPNSSYNALNFWYSSGTTNATRAGTVGVQSGTVNLWGVQLEIGSIATLLEKLPPNLDQINCLRYYQVCYASWFGYGAAGGLIGYTGQLPVVMRALPGITPVSPTYVNASGATAGAYGTQGTYQVQATATALGTASFILLMACTAEL